MSKTITETPIVIMLQTEGKKPLKVPKADLTKLETYIERMTKGKVTLCIVDNRNAITDTIE